MIIKRTQLPYRVFNIQNQRVRLLRLYEESLVFYRVQIAMDDISEEERAIKMKTMEESLKKQLKGGLESFNETEKNKETS